MGYDHAVQKELDIPSSSASSGGNNNTDGQVLEKQQQLEVEEDGDSIITVPDEEGKGQTIKRQHNHQFRRWKLRASDDDDPSDWWFASTAIPLIAATFAPMANLLSIAALVVYWRNNVTTTDPATAQETSQGYKDPEWCFDLNVASLICGFVGNLFLLFNFTKRVRYIVALPMTIVLFYMASGILIGIIVSMNTYVPPGQGQIYSQGFWSAVIAACLYMFNSMILMVNMWGYFLGHYPQHFTLTDEQRNLILQTMMFFIWLGGGAGVFARIEGWGYPDALYFCDVTILTIGFGDFYPTDNLGRGLVFPYSVGGTIILGLMVSSIHKFARELSKDNVLRKHVESRRVDTLSRAVTMEVDDPKGAELEQQLQKSPGAQPTFADPFPNPQSQPELEQEAAPKERQINFDDQAHMAKLKQDVESESQSTTSTPRRGPLRRTLHKIVRPVTTIREARSRSRSQKVILMRQEKDRFDAMRSIQMNATTFKRWYALLVSVIAFGILWCVGAIVFWQAERSTQGMTYFRALYFCYVSLLTIGYGDLSPRSNAGKSFFVVWSLIAVPTMTVLISDMSDTVIVSFKRGTFRLGDFTVLPKAGLWHDFLQAHPRLLDWINQRNIRKRLKRGMPVGPADDELPPQTIEELVDDDLSEGELTRRLAFAIRKTADDLTKSSGKRYSYEEWVEFTRLIRFTKIDVSDLSYDEEREGVVEWDWLDENSPMLSQQSESEWILDRLCESLLRLLKKNHLGIESAPNSAIPGGLPPVTPNRSYLQLDDSVDPKSEPRAKMKAPERQPSQIQERQRRASGADTLLTFFTGERRGTHTYAQDEPVWSKKARERMTERRRRKSSATRRGPFSRLEHSGRTGALGGGRGGAGLRSLKLKQMVDNEEL